MRRLAFVVVGLGCAGGALAGEGMWQPAQLPGVAKQLTAKGLRLDPAAMSDLTGQPMGAIVQIPGCTASFVSAQGLVVTNHHCAYGGLQYNSTPQRNLIKLGLNTARLEDELPGDPNARVYVTEEIRDVTAQVEAKLDPKMPGLKRHRAIEAAKKVLVADCEKTARYHCEVYTFHGGVSYQLVRQLEIKDVRLVYAPPDSIGKFGGEVDNWMWPRHTGDFAFLRAYVAPDGSGAPYAKENVPYQPKHWLEVNAKGLAAGDFAMIAGYPGRTYRYRLADEIDETVTWTYPTMIAVNEAELALIAEEGKRDPEVAVKYASTAASRNNALKKYRGVLEGFAKDDPRPRKREQEAALERWLAADPKRGAPDAVSAMRAFAAEHVALRERELVVDTLLPRSGAWQAAYSAYRLAYEHEKADKEREPGFQSRDEAKLEGSIKLLERRMDAATDQRLLALYLARYDKLPRAQRIASIDKYFQLDGTADPTGIAKRIAAVYGPSKVGDPATRLSWLKMSRQELDASTDPWLVFMRAARPELLAIERQGKERSGREAWLRPRYMRAMLAFNAERDVPVYPDANSSLRVTFGNVQGYAPKDGIEYLPFTTAAGVVAKTTGREPFNTPPRARELLAANPTLPVDFLSDLDITGGNSGSPTLDADGRLVGLAFDGVWESVAGDFAFMPSVNRTIHVDIRYMLWVIDKFDHAERLLAELGVRP